MGRRAASRSADLLPASKVAFFEGPKRARFLLGSLAGLQRAEKNRIRKLGRAGGCCSGLLSPLPTTHTLSKCFPFYYNGRKIPI